LSPRFTGIVPPLLTPLDANERLDRPAVKRLVDYIIEGGANGIFALGSMGEGPNLSLAVRQGLVEATVEASAGRVPVIAGVLRPNTAEVIDEIHAFSGLGLDGYVATSPYYYCEFTDDGLFEHFRRVLDAADLPTLLYSIPQATKVPLSADLVLRLAAHPMVAGVKDSSGNWNTVRTILQSRPSPDFTVLQGWTTMAVGSLLGGVDGLVPGEANIFPHLLAKLVAAVKAGDLATAYSCEAKVFRTMPVGGWLGVHALKLLGKAMGLMGDTVSLPMPRLSPAQAELVMAAGRAAGLPLKG